MAAQIRRLVHGSSPSSAAAYAPKPQAATQAADISSRRSLFVVWVKATVDAVVAPPTPTTPSLRLGYPPPYRLALETIRTALAAVEPDSEASRELVVEGWARLLGVVGGDASECDELLGRPEAVKASAAVADALLTPAMAAHRLKTLRWLAATPLCTVPPAAGLAQLIALCARAVALADNATVIGPILDTLGQVGPAGGGCEGRARLVEAIDALLPETKLNATEKLHEALRWLRHGATHEAARLYPRLLSRPNAPVPEAMAELLSLCEQSQAAPGEAGAADGVRFPPVPLAAARSALPALRASALPEARVQAVRVLAEDGQPSDAIRQLAETDDSAVVRAAANAALARMAAADAAIKAT